MKTGFNSNAIINNDLVSFQYIIRGSKGSANALVEA